MKYLKILILILIITNLYSQNRNSNWVFGFTDTLYGENCGKVLWHEDNDDISFKFVDTELNFESTVAAISDTASHLLLYTNGCSIADSTHKVILNGDGLNPGEVYDNSCPKIGYPVPNGAMFLPFPNDENKFILLHIGAKYDIVRNLKCMSFYYTIIENENGIFKVTEKNKTLLEDDIESFAVIRQGNGKDWWIFVPQYNSNKYYRFVFNENGIEEKEPLFVGMDLPNNLCKISGLSGFSPDGNKYLRFNRSCGYQLFDFDRCTGLLSNPVFESIGFIIDDHSADFSFSSDSKYLYINKLDHHQYHPIYLENKMYRIELDNIGVKAEPYVKLDLARHLRFNRFYRTIHDELYVLDAYSSDVLHYVNQSENSDVFLETNSLPLPVNNARTVPYFANFNLRKFNCDETSVTLLNNNKAPLIYPNPFKNNISVITAFPFNNCTLSILDIKGEIIFSEIIDKSDLEKRINLSFLHNGIYIFELNIDNHKYFVKAIKI